MKQVTMCGGRFSGALLGAALAAALLGGCAAGGVGEPEDGCPPAELAARYELVGSPRLCGGCDVDCHLTTDSPNHIDLGDLNSDGIEDTAHDLRVWANSAAYLPAPTDGIKIVPPGVRVTSDYAWVANTGVSTVTKVHLRNLTSDGVFRVGLQSIGTGGNTPSRTTVDILGCAYVAQRAHGMGSPYGQASVTKIAGDIEDCVDVNENGVIETSSGVGDILGWPGTVDQDECLLWQIPIPPGESGKIARAMSIDALGRVWVGMWMTREFIVVNSVDASIIARVPIANSPYGSAITPSGLLWYTYPGPEPGAGSIQSINTLTAFPSASDVGAVVANPVSRQYGIAVDQNDRVFTSNWWDPAGSGGINRYDPSTGTWTHTTNGARGRTSGMAVDEAGVVYGSDLYDSYITMYDAETLAILGAWSIAPSLRPHGVCPDFWGKLWTGNMGSANVTVLNPMGMDVLPADNGGGGSGDGVPDPVGIVTHIPVQANNYTYSDFTGYGLMTFAALVGYVFRDYESVDACGAQRSIRERLYWTASFDDPGVINFHGRSADTAADLPTAPEVWLGTADGSSAPGTISGSCPIRGPMTDTQASRYYFRLRIELLRAGISSPVIHEWTLEEYCI